MLLFPIPKCLLLLLVFTVGIQYLKAELALSSSPDDDKLSTDNQWRLEAIKKLWEERKQMKRTPLFKFDKIPGVAILFKNETASATGSLKHRFAWALVMWSLINGKIGENTTVYDASSGNTAFSEAYMCNLIGVKFVTVTPLTMDLIKAKHIEEIGGNVLKVEGDMHLRAEEEAQNDPNGFFINQFGNADLAEEFHESSQYEKESTNVFHEIVAELREQLRNGNDSTASPLPDFFVASAGTGGTISSVGRYIKLYGLPTEVVLADSQYSIYYDFVVNHRSFSGNESAEVNKPPGIPGVAAARSTIIGKTTSLQPSVIDRAIKVPDLASTAAIHVLKDNYSIDAGPSTGINFMACLHLVATSPKPKKEPLLISTLLADKGSNYLASYYNTTWIEQKFEGHGGLETMQCWKKVIVNFLEKQSNANDSTESPLLRGGRECSPRND